jgi:hypothetical protein
MIKKNCGAERLWHSELIVNALALLKGKEIFNF